MSASIHHRHAEHGGERRRARGRLHHACGPREKCHFITGFTSVGFDPDLAGIGGSPCCGDQGATGVIVPAAPTTDPCNRYLIRLGGVAVPRECGLIVVGLRTAVTLRAEVSNTDGSLSVFELEQTSPFFRFPDGNVSFHLMWKQDACGPVICDPDQQPATSPDLDCDDTSLLYTPPFPPGAPYVALNGGVPPGDGVGDLGFMRDLRFPWDHPDWVLSEIMWGPGVVTLYASVFQTDPARRSPCTLTPEQRDALRPEDKFACAFPQARYGRVAGSIVYELLPDCAECLGCE